MRCDKHDSPLTVRARCRFCDAEHQAPPLPSDAARLALPRWVSIVPSEDGLTVQIEGHTLQQDWELELDSDGNVVSYVCELTAAERDRLRASASAAPQPTGEDR